MKYNKKKYNNNIYFKLDVKNNTCIERQIRQECFCETYSCERFANEAKQKIYNTDIIILATNMKILKTAFGI